MPRGVRRSRASNATPSVAPPAELVGAAERGLHEAWSREAAGDWDAAIQQLTALVRSEARDVSGDWAVLSLASLLRRRGAGPRDLPRTPKRRAAATSSEWRFAQAEDLVRDAVERSDAPAAARFFAAMRRAAADLHGTWFRARLHLMEACVGLLAGDEAAAGIAIRRAQEWAERLGRPAELGRVLALSGDLALRRGERAVGDEFFEEALRVLESAPSRWDEARAWERWGCRTMDPATSVQRLRRGLAVYEALGARPAVERLRSAIEQRLRGGARTSRGPRVERQPYAVEIAWRLHVATDLGAVSAAVLDVAVDRLGARRARLVLLDSTSGRPRVAGERTAPQGAGRRDGADEEGESRERAFRRRLGYALAWGRSAGDGVETEAICQPLAWSDQVIGAIDIEAGVGRVFGEEERRFLERVARWTAPAIERALRLAELEAARARLGEENRALRREREAWRLPAAEAVDPAVAKSPGAEGSPRGERDDFPAYEESLVVFERRLFAEALAHCGGSIREAARCLGIARNTLRAKLRRYGLADVPESSLRSGRRTGDV